MFFAINSSAVCAEAAAIDAISATASPSHNLRFTDFLLDSRNNCSPALRRSHFLACRDARYRGGPEGTAVGVGLLGEKYRRTALSGGVGAACWDAVGRGVATSVARGVSDEGAAAASGGAGV
jgi:hypothetical protein